MKGRTAIVIAHRLSTVASLDRIVVLKNGKYPRHRLPLRFATTGKLAITSRSFMNFDK